MKRIRQAGLLEGLTTQQLQNLIAVKKKIDVLSGKRKSIEKELASVTKQISSLETSIAKIGGKKGARVRKAAKKAVKSPSRKRPVQPPLSSLIVEILKEKKRPMKINDLHDALLKEKRYKTRAKNFKANVRILLYKNDKGLFRKVGPGRFALAKSKKK